MGPCMVTQNKVYPEYSISTEFNLFVYPTIDNVPTHVKCMVQLVMYFLVMAGRRNNLY